MSEKNIRWSSTLTCASLGAAIALSLGACGASAGAPSAEVGGVSVESEAGAPAPSSEPGSTSNPSSTSAPGSAGAQASGGAQDASQASPSNDASAADESPSLPLCGAVPCDLRTNTCCLPTDGGLTGAQCKPGAMTACGAGSAAFHCQQTSDCSGGDVCCGVYDLSTGTAQTQCQAGTCQIAQFCKTSAECLNGQSCTEQICQGQAMLQLCGVQTALGCVAR